MEEGRRIMVNVGYVLRDDDLEVEWHGDAQTLVVRRIPPSSCASTGDHA